MRHNKLLIAAVFMLSLLSCNSVSSKDTNSLLWKVSGNGLEKPSYLFGTHHLIPLSFLDSVKGLTGAFQSTEQTVGELDLSNMGEMQMKLMGGSIMPEGVTYSSLLNEKDVALLDSTLHNTLGIGLDQLGQMKPAMITNLLTLTMYQKYYPKVSQEKSMDEYFQNEAATLFRPVKGLETIDDQIYALLNSQPLERQAEILICTIKNPALLKEQMDQMQQAYYAHDLEKIKKLYEEDVPDDPCPATQAEKDVINKDRNQKWLTELPEIMKEKSSFIAVGCAHLPGKDGLIEGLRAQGFTVEPVK